MASPGKSERSISARRKEIAATKDKILGDMQKVFGEDFRTSTEGAALAKNAELFALHDRVTSECEFALGVTSFVGGLFAAWSTFSHKIFGHEFQSNSLLWPYQTKTFFVGLLFYIVAAILSVLLLGGCAMIVTRLRERILLPLAVYLLPFYAVCIPALPRVLAIYGYVSYPRSPWLQGCTAALFATTAFWAGFCCVAFALAPLLSLARNLQIASFPDLYFQYFIMRSISALQDTPSLPHPSLKAPGPNNTSVMACINTAASALRAFEGRYLNPSLKAEEWYVKSLDRRVAALRSLGKWLLLPKSDTKTQLELRLREYSRLAAAGNWDALPDAEPDARPASLQRRVWHVMRSLVLAGLPPSAVALLKTHHMLPPGQIELYITAGAWLWALANVMSLLDPRVKEKLSNIKELSSFPFFSKGKDS